MRRHVIFITIFIVDNCNNFLLSGNTSELGKTIAQLLQFYDNYDRIFYLDKETVELYENTRQFFILNKRKNPLYIQNYDRSTEIFPRPRIAKAVQIVFSQNISLWRLLNKKQYINYRDVIIFVANNINLRDTLLENQENTFRRAGKVLLLEAENLSIQLYKICFYCGQLQSKLQPINISRKEIFPDDFKNLNGQKMKLVFMPNYPFAYCDHSSLVGNWKMCDQINGIESHMVRVIARKMNFSFIVVELEPSRSSYFKMLTNMHKHDTDIAFGAISMTLTRRNVIEFTTQYHTEDFNLMYRTSLTFLDVLEKFFDPFSSPILWVLLLVAYVLIAVLLFFMQFVRRQEKVSLRNCFWILLQIQLEQAIAGNSFKTSQKRSPCWGAMLLLWCACCMVLCAAYKGATLSSLVSPSRTEPETLAQLVTEGYQIVASNQSLDIIQDSLNVSDPVYRQTLKRMEYGSTICEVFAEVLSEKSRTALLNEWSMIQFQIRRECPKPGQKEQKLIRIARRPVMNAGHAWATRVGAPYKQGVDYYLGLILSGGLFDKWRRDHTFQQSRKYGKPFRLSRQLSDEVESVALSLPTFYPLLLIYGIGITCSALCFLYEHIKFHYRRVKILSVQGAPRR